MYQLVQRHLLLKQSVLLQQQLGLQQRRIDLRCPKLQLLIHVPELWPMVSNWTNVLQLVADDMLEPVDVRGVLLMRLSMPDQLQFGLCEQ